MTDKLCVIDQDRSAINGGAGEERVIVQQSMSIEDAMKRDAALGVYKSIEAGYKFVEVGNGNLVCRAYRTYDGITEFIEPNDDPAEDEDNAPA